MYCEWGRSVVHNYDIFDVSSLEELNQVLYLEFAVRVRRAILSRDNVVEVTMVFLDLFDDGLRIDIIARCEKDQLEMALEVVEHLEEVGSIGDIDVFLRELLDLQKTFDIIKTVWQFWRVISCFD